MGWVVNATFRPLYTRERDPVPVVQEDGLAAGLPVRKMSPVPGLDTWPIQLVVSHFTGYAITALM